MSSSSCSSQSFESENDDGIHHSLPGQHARGNYEISSDEPSPGIMYHQYQEPSRMPTDVDSNQTQNEELRLLSLLLQHQHSQQQEQEHEESQSAIQEQELTRRLSPSAGHNTVRQMDLNDVEAVLNRILHTRYERQTEQQRGHQGRVFRRMLTLQQEQDRQGGLQAQGQVRERNFLPVAQEILKQILEANSVASSQPLPISRSNQQRQTQGEQQQEQNTSFTPPRPSLLESQLSPNSSLFQVLRKHLLEIVQQQQIEQEQTQGQPAEITIDHHRMEQEEIPHYQGISFLPARNSFTRGEELDQPFEPHQERILDINNSLSQEDEQVSQEIKQHGPLTTNQEHHESQSLFARLVLPGEAVAATVATAATAKMDEDDVVTIACKARRGLGADHNFKTAFFRVRRSALKHGRELLCSHEACRRFGIRFMYCAFCDDAVAKANFSTRHSHDDRKPKAKHPIPTTNRVEGGDDSGDRSTEQEEGTTTTGFASVTGSGLNFHGSSMETAITINQQQSASQLYQHIPPFALRVTGNSSQIQAATHGQKADAEYQREQQYEMLHHGNYSLAPFGLYAGLNDSSVSSIVAPPPLTLNVDPQFYKPDPTAEGTMTLPCKARKGLGTDHNFQTAQFRIKRCNLRHGLEMVCSHEGCRNLGVRFLYCAYCNEAVAKANFSTRHSHAERVTGMRYNKNEKKNHTKGQQTGDVSQRQRNSGIEIHSMEGSVDHEEKVREKASNFRSGGRRSSHAGAGFAVLGTIDKNPSSSTISEGKQLSSSLHIDQKQKSSTIQGKSVSARHEDEEAISSYGDNPSFKSGHDVSESTSNTSLSDTTTNSVRSFLRNCLSEKRKREWVSLLDSKPDMKDKDEMANWLGKVLECSDPENLTPPSSQKDTTDMSSHANKETRTESPSSSISEECADG